MIQRRGYGHAMASRARQAGAAAIEFALLFVLFFALFYALVSYAIAMMLQASFVHAAQEGARAAIAIDPLVFPDVDAYNGGVEARVRSTVDDALDWLPLKAKTRVTGEGVQIDWSGSVMTVRVVYAGYASDPLLPVLDLPIIGEVPRLPTDLAGTATLDFIVMNN